MVSQQPQSRGDAMAGMTPKPGASASQASGGDAQGGAGHSSQTQQKVGEVTDQAKQQAGEVVDQAKQQATSQLSSQKDRLVDSLGTVADALRQSGKHLRENDQQGFAQYADKAAERVEQFSDQLRGKDVQEIVRDVERYARQQPALVLGGAFVLGLLGARFLKSTAQREGDGGSNDYRYRGNQSGGYQPGYYSGAYGNRYGSGEYGGETMGDRAGVSGVRERNWYVRGTEMR